METSDPTNWSRIETIFASFLGRLEAGEQVDFERLCAEHVEFESGLRELHADWTGLRGVLEILEESGAGVASTPIDWDRFVDPERLFGEILARLRSRAGAFERYEIVREIGRGGMGVVVEANDRELSRRVALKFLRAQWDAPQGETVAPPDARLLARFFGEARITSRLAHPGIPPVHEIAMDPRGRFYYAMELVEGEDFSTVIDKVRGGKDGWTVPRALADLLKAAYALAHAHEHGVVHRDLKPANVMVGSFGRVYVMDWGLAHSPWSTSEYAGVEGGHDPDASSLLRTRPGQVVGTALYMAPEQAHAELEHVEARSDVYAMGAILYHLLAGHRPYCEDGRAPRSFDEAVDLVKRGAPATIERAAPDAAPELHSICNRAMQRERERRYVDMGELAGELSAFLEGRVVPSHRTGAWIELRKWIGRNHLAAGSIAAAIVALIAGLAASWVLRGRELHQLGLARAAANAEKEARDQVRRQLAESHVRQAELAGQRGQWSEVLDALEKARMAGFHDELDLDIRKARAFVALSRRDPANGLLTRLEAHPRIGPRLGEVLLLQGDLALSEWGDHEHAFTLVRCALESEGLGDADREFAKGLLDPSMEGALSAFQRATKLQPFHHGALNYSLVLLALTGRFDEAMAQAGAFEALYPEDPSGPVLEAFVLGLSGKEAEARNVVELARERGLGDEIVAIESFLDLVKIMPWFDDREALIGAGGDALPSAEQTQIILDLVMEGSGLQALQQITANLPCVRLSWGKFLEGVRALFVPDLNDVFAMANSILGKKPKDVTRLPKGDWAKARECFAEASLAHPDALFLYFEAACVMQLLGDKAQWPEKLREAEALYLRAAQAPSFFPQVPRASRYWAAHAQQAIFELSGHTDQEMLRRALEGLREHLALGDTLVQECARLSELAGRLGEPTLSAAFLERWLELAPEDPVPSSRLLRLEQQ